MAGYPPLSDYAPYAAHVLEVEVFFQIALGANLISAERASNRVDIAYLFYLPFCMVFISSDRLHQRCTPHFLRSDQEFVWGEDLKADLRRLNDRYATLSAEVKEQGIISFAPSPPEDGDFIVSQLWDRHLHPWRGRPTQRTPTDPGKEKELVSYLSRFNDAPTASGADAQFDLDDVDTVSIQRLVQRRKGAWWQVPKDLKESDEK